jgi:hypothetical protein
MHAAAIALMLSLLTVAGAQSADLAPYSAGTWERPRDYSRVPSDDVWLSCRGCRIGSLPWGGLRPQRTARLPWGGLRPAATPALPWGLRDERWGPAHQAETAVLITKG